MLFTSNCIRENCFKDLLLYQYSEMTEMMMKQLAQNDSGHVILLIDLYLVFGCIMFSGKPILSFLIFVKHKQNEGEIHIINRYG